MIGAAQFRRCSIRRKTSLSANSLCGEYFVRVIYPGPEPTLISAFTIGTSLWLLTSMNTRRKAGFSRLRLANRAGQEIFHTYCPSAASDGYLSFKGEMKVRKKPISTLPQEHEWE
jgi:hypothetical protein